MEKNNTPILIYQSNDGSIKLDVHLEDETVWLTQEQIAQLFGKAKSTINEHINNIFTEGALISNCCMKKFGNSEFQQRAPNYYNLGILVKDTEFKRNQIFTFKRYLGIYTKIDSHN